VEQKTISRQSGRLSKPSRISNRTSSNAFSDGLLRRWVCHSPPPRQDLLRPSPVTICRNWSHGLAGALVAFTRRQRYDIKTFIQVKKPRNEVQFAATVAYYYRFEAPHAERKEAIDQETLQDATRRAGRGRFANPLTTLGNAHRLGLLDRGAEKGTFTINTVGENLVAMTLPDTTANVKPAKKRAAKRAAKKVKKA
jgi:hypothetical protein